MLSATVVGAAVPEAAVHEYCDPGAAEYDVRPPGYIGLWPNVDPVTEPGCVQEAADGQLGLGVTATDGLHATSDARGRGEGALSTGHRVTLPGTLRGA